MEKGLFLTVLLIIVAAVAVNYLYFIFNGAPKKIEVTQPIISGQETATATTLKIFFSNDKLDPEISCNKVFPVERNISETTTPAKKALELLLEGPTNEERNQKYFTSIPAGVKIKSVSISNGVAKADFDEQLEFQVGGSCRVSAIRAQIEETLKQFSTVTSVVISINGRTEDILQP